MIHFEWKAHESRESFMVLEERNMHPLSHGHYCDGAKCKEWLNTHWKDPAFSRAARKDEHSIPMQPLEDVVWLPQGAAGSITDADGKEHQLYFDVRCRHLARTFLEIIGVFGPKPTFFLDRRTVGRA